MKKILLLFVIICSSITLNAQNDTIWRKGGVFNASFNQVNLTNWAGGGQNAISFNTNASLFAHYTKARLTWDNNLDLGYGIVKNGDEQVRKNDDRMELNSKLGYKAGKGALYYTLLFNFKSQFAAGYNYPRSDSSNYISKFAAPAFTLISLGADYKPNEYFSFFISPITARLIIVNDDSLADAGAFGVDPGDHLREELGAYINTRFQKDIMKNVNLMAKLDLFSNYLDNPQNIDVNGEILLNLKVNKFISASLGMQVVYDDNTQIALYETKNGIQTPKTNSDGSPKTGKRTQFRQTFGIGLTFNIEKFTVR